MDIKLSVLVGQNIRKFRLKRKLTQEGLEEISSVDVKYIQKIEGKTPPNISLKVIEKLTKALKISPDKLFK